MRYTLPQPYRELDHTADVGVEVEGASAEEAVARLVLAMSALLTGGGPTEVRRELTVEVGPGPALDRAVDLLRELLYHFDTEQEIAASCEVTRWSDEGAAIAVGFAPWDPDAHEEGTELKAVTLHEACFEPSAGGFVARIVFNV